MKELVAAAGQPGTVSGRDAVARSGTRYTGGLQGKKGKKQRVSGIFRRRRPVLVLVKVLRFAPCILTYCFTYPEIWRPNYKKLLGGPKREDLPVLFRRLFFFE